MLTWCTVVNQSAEGDSVLPASLEVGDRHVGDSVLDPAEETLLGSGLGLLHVLVFVVPHRHGDGVVQDEGPDETEDQLQVAIDDSFTVCCW